VAVSFIEGGNRSTRKKPPTSAILELIRGAQFLIEGIRSSGEEM
jgi:hypothetical protein